MSMRKLVSQLGALALVGGLVAGILFFEGGSLPAAASAMPDQASAPPPSVSDLVRPYPGLHSVSVARGMQVNGQHMDLDVGLVDASLDDVISYYQSQLDRPGAPVRSKALPDGSVYLVASRRQGRLEGVVLRQVNAGTGHAQVLVMPTLTSGPVAPGREAKNLTVPLPPKHSGLMSYRTSDGNRQGTSAAFLTDTGVKALSAWYRDRLTAAGWSPAAIGGNQTAPHDTRMLRYRRADRKVTVSLKGLDTGGTAVVILEEQEVGR